MNNRALLTAGAALLAAAAAALAAPGIAGATAAAPAARTAGAPVSAASFMSGSGQATVGAMAGVIAARGTSQSAVAAAAAATAPRQGALAAAPAAGCKEPDCNMGYHGGPVQHTPRAYLLFWGPQWSNPNNVGTQNARRFVTNFYRGLGKAPDTWSLTASQYHDKTGKPTFGKGILAGIHVDTSKPPSSVTPTNLGNEAAKGIGIFKIKDVKNAEVIILAQSGTCFRPISGLTFAGNCGKPQTSGYCAYHNFDTNSNNRSLFLPWVNLPFQPNAGGGCNGAGVVSNPGTYDGFSITGGHETMETITDPAENAWYDANDGVSGGEIADKCAWGGQPFGDNDPFGKLKLSTGSWPMQSLWSNAANRHCVMTGKLKLFVRTPPTQHTKRGQGVSYQMFATISGRTPLRWGQSGLPKGLVISKTTGKITGRPTVRGTFNVKITASYYAGSATVRFQWIIS